MKVYVTMKTPDALREGIKDAIEDNKITDKEERQVFTKNTFELAEKWFEYKEYIQLEIDTATAKIRVLTQDEINQ